MREKIRTATRMHFEVQVEHGVSVDSEVDTMLKAI